MRARKQRAMPLGGRLKRSIDLALAATALVLVAPLLVVLGALIRLDGGPAIYAHPRVGHRGRTFHCLKLRSMVVDGDAVLRRHLADNPASLREWQETRKLREDPRVTAIGAFVRQTSLDELPQLLNVLRGEMSLVGPRPVTAEELARYGPHAPAYLATRPGVTGLWQISGRNDVSYERRVELDHQYVTGWSVLADVRIMVRTIPAVLQARGSY